MTLDEKQQRLAAWLRQYPAVAVAFSGGVDSTFLLAAAVAALGREQVVALTVASEFSPAWEGVECRTLAASLQVRHLVIESRVSDDPEIARNDPQRCYYCKRRLFAALWAEARRLEIPVLADGSNVDDLSDYRPGKRALAELGVASPLVEAELGKGEIRELSRLLDLPTWEQPSFACLASRFPYGTTITPARLAQVEECEEYLRQHGFRCYRVRYHGDTARIEVEPADMERLLRSPAREDLVRHFREAGFTYVALDLAGYRTGSLNEVAVIADQMN